MTVAICQRRYLHAAALRNGPRRKESKKLRPRWLRGGETESARWHTAVKGFRRPAQRKQWCWWASNPDV
jgi:hypothetical protein